MASTDGMTFDDLMAGEKSDGVAPKGESSGKRPRSMSYLGWTQAVSYTHLTLPTIYSV